MYSISHLLAMIRPNFKVFVKAFIQRARSLSQRNGDARGKTWLHRIPRAVEEVCVRAGVCGEGRGGEGGR
jgi:hypothetical protein